MERLEGRYVGSWWHLVRRFFEVATARRLSVPELETVATWFSNGGEADVFFAQSRADQQHAFRAACRVASLAPERRDLIRAALFHDVGKRQAAFGIVRRSVAGAITKLRLPLRGRYATYVAHGRLAAQELSALGCETVVVDFARSHHDDRPASIRLEDWRLLETADLPGKAPGPGCSAIR